MSDLPAGPDEEAPTGWLKLGRPPLRPNRSSGRRIEILDQMNYHFVATDWELQCFASTASALRGQARFRGSSAHLSTGSN